MPQTSASGDPSNYGGLPSNGESAISGVSWGAVIAGAFVTAALSLILLALGAGFGLLSVSPWARAGASASVVTAGAIIWLIVIQIIASGGGGYLAGRLRTKWARLHGDEVYFRDTAHGLIVWAVAVVITAAFLGSATSAMAGRAMASAESASSGEAYFADLLLRPTPGAATPATNTGAANAENAGVHREAAIALASVLSKSDHAAQDQAYLTQLVVARTGLNQSEAAKRVSETIRRAREATDKVRKEGARLLLWTFLALLIGAFCASYAATIGGRQRDHIRPV
jgi:hypothetical protein